MRISDWSSDVCSSDLSKLTRQADIEPEAGSPQSRSQPRARARRPAGEQITVCLGPLKKLIPESSVEGLPVAIGIVIVFRWPAGMPCSHSARLCPVSLTTQHVRPLAERPQPTPPPHLGLLNQPSP